MSRTLKLGSHGKEVTLVQEALNRNIDAALKVDGKFGPKTQDAVRRFQTRAGFSRAQIDGQVGPQTTVALFQLFDINVTATLTPKEGGTGGQSAPSPTKPPTTPKTPAPSVNSNVPTAKKEPDEEHANRFAVSLLGGLQDSKRDSVGVPIQLSLTVRANNFFPKSNKKKFYHGMHGEYILQTSLGIPLPGSSIYTGQLNVLVQPVTDWLVFGGWHFLTPSAGLFVQGPFNGNASNDTSNHGRFGANFGMEIFHYDLIDNILSIGVQGSEAGYVDLETHRVYWDPSVLVFLAGQINFGPRTK